MANNSQYPGIQPPRPVAPMGPPPNTYPSVPLQFRQAGPPRPTSSYMPMVPPPFLNAGRPNMVSQPMQHLPLRPGPPPPPLAHSIVTPPPPLPAAQAFSLLDGLSNRPILPVSPHAQQTVTIPNNYMAGQNGPMVAHPITYNLPMPATAQVPSLQPAEQTSGAPSVPVTPDQPKAVEKAPSDWIEHTSKKGKRYYHNIKTKLSSWEKPLDLMSPIERADATTNWKEHKAPDGKKYYYNNVTKQSKWRIPDELKLVREQVLTGCTTNGHELGKVPNIEPVVSVVTDSPSSQPHEPLSSPVSVVPSSTAVQPVSVVNAELSTRPTESSKVTENAAEETAVPAAPALSNTENVLVKDAVIAENGTPVGNIEESKSANVAALEEKGVDQDPHVYESKEEAKSAFKNLLKSSNVASDWIWEQTMRVIINDRRYSALRTLAERKQAFSEYIAQKKKQEVEERRNKQKKAREEYKKMLEDSKELTSSTKWRDAILIFEDDDRFKAVERPKEREDLFDDHIAELGKKERSKAFEEHKRNRKEYIEYLKSCDFLMASSQWRKVQDRLEADERCSRLEKIDQIEIFQEYIRELEKQEEEQRKLRLEELRKTERKNRDEFRKLMEGHSGSGMLTSKTMWRDYLMRVKDLPAYAALSSNSSGATPKELFEDVTEELEKQFIEDRDQIKEAVKMRKVSILSSWTLEDFRNAVAEDISSPKVSDVNLKIVFVELLERVREREEKEAKKRIRLADDFYISLTASKEITYSSRWEDFKPLFEVESWYTLEESFFKEIFDKYIVDLKKARDERKHREDKAKERERRADKSRRDKDRGKKAKRRKDETDSENGDNRGDSGNHDENRRSGRDKDNKHRKRYSDDPSLDESRDSHRHSAEWKRTKQLEQQSSVSAEYESRHKRHKRDQRRGDYDDQKEAEDGEVW